MPGAPRSRGKRIGSARVSGFFPASRDLVGPQVRYLYVLQVSGDMAFLGQEIGDHR